MNRILLISALNSSTRRSSPKITKSFKKETLEMLPLQLVEMMMMMKMEQKIIILLIKDIYTLLLIIFLCIDNYL